jgi:tRNA wybutosine-synthesizing protein 3
MSFAELKKEYLKRLSEQDKSKKGSIDKKIIPLIEKINAHKDYVTTSSCSGRILFLAIDDSGDKFDSDWPFVSHEIVNFEDILVAYSSLSTRKKVWFKMEAPILHVSCSSMNSALRLLAIAQSSGFRHSGIFQNRDHDVLIEIIGSERVETIVMKSGEKLISDSYLRDLVSESNEKLVSSHKKLDQFLVNLDAL